MIRTSTLRTALLSVSVASILAFSSTAGAASMGTYSAKDAALVPSALKHVTWQIATDATYAPDESMSGNTMVGFDVDLIKAIGTTLGVKSTKTT